MLFVMFCMVFVKTKCVEWLPILDSRCAEYFIFQLLFWLPIGLLFHYLQYCYFILLAAKYYKSMRRIFPLSFQFLQRKICFANSWCKLINKNQFTFSSKKDKTGSQKQRMNKITHKQSGKTSKQGKTYNLEGIEFDKLPEHLKKAYIMRKQAHNLQVPSESELQSSIIISEIKRQRKQIESQTEEHTQGDNEGMPKRLFLQTFLMGLAGSNVLLTAMLSFPVLPNHYFWLGVYSSSILYPSLLVTTCLCVGVNLAYLVLRQGLGMYTKVEDLKQLNITSAPLSYYLQMGLLLLQVFSLATSISLPLLLHLPENFKTYAIYATIFFLLSTNAHTTLQQKNFTNPKFKFSIHSICFVIMFFLSSYIYLNFSMIQHDTTKEKKDRSIINEFQQGRRKFQQIWKINRTIIDKNEKITDIISKQEQKPTNDSKVSQKLGDKIWKEETK